MELWACGRLAAQATNTPLWSAQSHGALGDYYSQGLLLLVRDHSRSRRLGDKAAPAFSDHRRLLLCPASIIDYSLLVIADQLLRARPYARACARFLDRRSMRNAGMPGIRDA